MTRLRAKPVHAALLAMAMIPAVIALAEDAAPPPKHRRGEDPLFTAIQTSPIALVERRFNLSVTQRLGDSWALGAKATTFSNALGFGELTSGNEVGIRPYVFMPHGPHLLPFFRPGIMVEHWESVPKGRISPALHDYQQASGLAFEPMLGALETTGRGFLIEISGGALISQRANKALGSDPYPDPKWTAALVLELQMGWAF